MKDKAESTKAAKRGVLHYLALGLSAGFFALILGLAAVVIVIPYVTGSTPLTVLTSSMEPKLPPGTLIVVKPEPVQDITIGDVVTYQIKSGDPAVVSHRVVRIGAASDGSRTFITKGDNNDQPDANAVTAKQIKGVVWYSVPWIGYVSTTVNGPDRAWFVPLIAVLLLCYAGYMLAAGIVEAARKRKKKSDDEGEAPAPEPVEVVEPVIKQAAVEQAVVKQPVAKQPAVEQAVVKQPVKQPVIKQQPAVKQAAGAQAVIYRAPVRRPVVRTSRPKVRT